MRMQKTILWIGIISLGSMLLFPAGCENDDGAGTQTAAVSAGTDTWLTDFEQAKQLAQQENKDLLVNFAGSDWCYWCKKLDQEVFSKPAFEQQAREEFVFVLVDFPRDTSGQSDAIQEQNERLAQRFGVEGFPTVFLADASGQPYAQTGYREGGVETYLDHLRELKDQKTGP